MMVIRYALLITIVLATSLSAIQGQDDEKSLKNLCLNHFAHNVPQAVELITGDKAPVSLKLELMLKLKKDTIEQYHEALWNYIKTFTNPKDDALLLMTDIANKMPERFLNDHKNEIMGFPFTVTCQVVETNPCLQTREVFKSLCSQGPITDKIAELMAKQFSLNDLKETIAYKKKEHYTADMRAHGNEKTLLHAFILQNDLITLADGSNIAEKYPINSLDEYFAINSCYLFLDYLFPQYNNNIDFFNVIMKPHNQNWLTLNPIYELLRDKKALNRIFPYYSRIQEAIACNRLIEDGWQFLSAHYDEYAELIKIYFDEIDQSALTPEMTIQYNQIKEMLQLLQETEAKVQAAKYNAIHKGPSIDDLD